LKSAIGNRQSLWSFAPARREIVLSGELGVGGGSDLLDGLPLHLGLDAAKM
jgi:hypothetical protein